jgi:hypothetical protein
VYLAQSVRIAWIGSGTKGVLTKVFRQAATAGAGDDQQLIGGPDKEDVYFNGRQVYIGLTKNTTLILDTKEGTLKAAAPYVDAAAKAANFESALITDLRGRIAPSAADGRR